MDDELTPAAQNALAGLASACQHMTSGDWDKLWAAVADSEYLLAEFGPTWAADRRAGIITRQQCDDAIQRRRVSNA